MTAVIVALLTIPLAALTPWQQPAPSSTKPDEFPASFKVTIGDGKASPNTPASGAGAGAGAVSGAGAMSGPTPMWPTPLVSSAGAASKTQKSWSCDDFASANKHTGTHISVLDGGSGDVIQYYTTTSDRCAEAAVLGNPKFSPDETHITQLSSGGFARFRERTGSFDRGVAVTPVGDGSLSYNATVNGRSVPFDGEMQQWLQGFLPEVLREASINVPDRVARLRQQGGVPAVLAMISRIRSTGSRRNHYEELLKGPLTSAEVERIASQIPKDLAASSGDLSSIVQKLPRSVFQKSGPRQALAEALDSIKSSGDKAITLEILAPNADPDLLILLAKAAEDLASSGDKANFLAATAAEYLTPRNAALRDAYFRAARTLQSSGDLANVLATATPYGHADPGVTFAVIESSRTLQSSGDAANVLLGLVSQRLLLSNTPKATLAVIQRTLTMGSSGDRANVLLALSSQRLLDNSEVREAFLRATAALPSDSDKANVLSSVARQ